MKVTLSDLVVWLIVGGLAGWVTGALVKRKKEGFGHVANLGVGMVGAVLGGLLFGLFRIGEGLQAISVNLQDIVAAVVGSLLFLGGVWIVRRIKAKKADA